MAFRGNLAPLRVACRRYAACAFTTQPFEGKPAQLKVYFSKARLVFLSMCHIILIWGKSGRPHAEPASPITVLIDRFAFFSLRLIDRKKRFACPVLLKPGPHLLPGQEGYARTAYFSTYSNRCLKSHYSPDAGRPTQLDRLPALCFLQLRMEIAHRRPFALAFLFHGITIYSGARYS